MPKRTHQCWFDDCDLQIPSQMLMCREHWYQVPKHIRDEVWKAYRTSGPLSEEWWEAVTAANESLK